MRQTNRIVAIRQDRRTRPRPYPASVAGAGRRRRDALREVALVLVVTAVYYITRGMAGGRASVAILHADDILSIERALHLDPEAAIQRLTLSHGWLLQAGNGFYLVGHLPVLIAVAIWLYRAHPATFRVFRNAFIISAALGLAVYIAWPAAPPRFLPGFTDTLKATGIGLDGSAVGLLYNPYAAMPSLHVGWSLLAGIAIVTCARSRLLQAAGATLPVLMSFVVLATGNHFLLDVVAGALIALVAWACAVWLTRLHAHTALSVLRNAIVQRNPSRSRIAPAQDPLDLESRARSPRESGVSGEASDSEVPYGVALLAEEPADRVGS